MSLVGAQISGRLQFFDNNGDPLASGSVLVTVASSSTHFPVFSDSALTSPVTQGTYGASLDSAGMITLFVGGDAYDVVLYDSTNTPVTGGSVAAQENYAQTQIPILGNTFVTGQRGMTTGQSIGSSDNFVTVSSSGTNPTVINLPAATRGMPVGIQNVGTNPVAITPHGSDSINALSASTVMTLLPAVAATQTYPTVWLLPDGTNNWRATSTQPPNTVITGLTAGVKMVAGTVSLDGSNPTTVTPGLGSITSVQLTINSLTAPSGGGTATVTYVPTGGTQIDIYAFKSDGTASTGTETVAWLALGTAWLFCLMGLPWM